MRQNYLTKAIIGILALLGLGVGVYFLYGTGAVDEPQISVEDVPLIERTELYAVDAAYPRFIGVSEQFNAAIETTAVGLWNEFKKMTEENWIARIETMPEGDDVFESPEEPFEFSLSYEITQLSDEYISLVFLYGGYPAGGAHGYASVSTLTYDVSEGRTVALGDIFASDPDYLVTLSTYVEDELVRQMQERFDISEAEVDTDWIRRGAGPKNANYINFTLSEASVIVYFSPYQVAPYAAGMFIVEVPLSLFTTQDQ
jgi:hypothetical protein